MNFGNSIIVWGERLESSQVTYHDWCLWDSVLMGYDHPQQNGGITLYNYQPTALKLLT
jgi:hypothetical protein